MAALVTHSLIRRRIELLFFGEIRLHVTKQECVNERYDKQRSAVNPPGEKITSFARRNEGRNPSHQEHSPNYFYHND